MATWGDEGDRLWGLRPSQDQVQPMRSASSGLDTELGGLADRAWRSVELAKYTGARRAPPCLLLAVCQV